MDKRKQCKHDEQAIVLYHYDELNAEERAAVEAQLKLCASCRAVLAELELVQQAIPARPALEPEEETLHALRSTLISSLPAPRPSLRRQASTWWNELRWMQPIPLMARLAVAVVLVGVGFWMGHRPAGTPEALEDLVLARAPVQAEHGTISPAFAGVRTVEFDPATGTVEIQYNTVNEVAVRGLPGDAAVQALLEQALLDDTNPVARLYAAKALQAAPPTQAAPDSQLVAALTFLMENESNEGIRLQAIEALRTLYRQTPLSASARQSLLNVLMHDKNSALRIEALELLTEQSRAAQLATYLDAVREDPNDFIRLQVQNLLSRPDSAQPLEQLPGGPSN